ncbi:hypothetical protein Hanom_Chr09g00832821 [Helianthus anomalus]
MNLSHNLSKNIWVKCLHLFPNKLASYQTPNRIRNHLKIFPTISLSQFLIQIAFKCHSLYILISTKLHQCFPCSIASIKHMLQQIQESKCHFVPRIPFFQILSFQITFIDHPVTPL